MKEKIFQHNGFSRRINYLPQHAAMNISRAEATGQAMNALGVDTNQQRSAPFLVSSPLAFLSVGNLQPEILMDAAAIE
jgi:hypothetical protein